MKGILTVEDHNRDVAGLKYVYPVVSRRAGGVSVGINLNTNNACNWHCVYCQVPDLTRGRAPEIDVDRLERELERMLFDIRDGDFMIRHVDAPLRRLCDIAFSGNGEPTSAAGLANIVERVGKVRERLGYGNEVPLRLITNGSLVGQEGVLDGIGRLARFAGEVWFKVDAISTEDIRRINGVERHVYPHMFCDSYANFWQLFEQDLDRAAEELGFEAKFSTKETLLNFMGVLRLKRFHLLGEEPSYAKDRLHQRKRRVL